MSEKIYDMVTLETIEKLADLVAAKDLGEITIASEDKCITIKGKKCPPPMPPMGVPMAAPAGRSGSCCICSGSRSGGEAPQRQDHQVAHRRHILRLSLSGSASLCTGGRHREKGRCDHDYRIHEADE